MNGALEAGNIVVMGLPKLATSVMNLITADPERILNMLCTLFPFIIMVIGWGVLMYLRQEGVFSPTYKGWAPWRQTESVEEELVEAAEEWISEDDDEEI